MGEPSFYLITHVIDASTLTTPQATASPSSQTASSHAILVVSDLLIVSISQAFPPPSPPPAMSVLLLPFVSAGFRTLYPRVFLAASRCSLPSCPPCPRRLGKPSSPKTMMYLVIRLLLLLLTRVARTQGGCCHSHASQPQL